MLEGACLAAQIRPQLALTALLPYFIQLSGSRGCATQVPIYIILSFEYAVLTLRFWRLLDKDARVFLFPFFSVGVNLFFISLLDKYESDIILNPLFQCAALCGPQKDPLPAALCYFCCLTFVEP